MEVLGSLFVKKERWMLKMLVACASDYDRTFTIRETECYAGLICVQFATSPRDNEDSSLRASYPPQQGSFASRVHKDHERVNPTP